MSESLTFEANGLSMGTLNINSIVESGVYAGVCVQRVIYTGSVPESSLATMTSKARFISKTSPNYDVDCLFLRKVTNVHNGTDTQSSMTVAFYFEFHIHKKKAVNTPIVISFNNTWFTSFVRLFAADTLHNTSFFSIESGTTNISMFETDPARKARQIYDSV